MNRRYLLLAFLYTSQFLPLGFFYIALTALLRREGVSLERIGLIHLLALVWVLKSLWAPLIDRFAWGRLGHYRGWLIALQCLMVVGVIALVPVDPIRQPVLLFSLIAVIAFLSATQDVAVDALAVRMLEVDERGPGNGIQIASGNLGAILGGGGLLLVFERFGWEPTVVVLAVLIAAPILPVVFLLEPESDRPTGDAGSRVSFAGIIGLFRQPGLVPWMWMVVPFFYLGISIPTRMIAPMLVDAGWPLGRVGTVASIGGGTIAIVAALGAGMLMRSRTRRISLMIIGAVQLAALLATVPLAGGSSQISAGLASIVLLNAAYAATGAAVFTINMDKSRPRLAGTDYAVLSSWAIIWSDVFGAAAISAAGRVGYLWTTAAAIALASVGLTAVIRVTWLQTAAEPSGSSAA